MADIKTVGWQKPVLQSELPVTGSEVRVVERTQTG